MRTRHDLRDGIVAGRCSSDGRGSGLPGPRTRRRRVHGAGAMPDGWTAHRSRPSAAALLSLLALVFGAGRVALAEDVAAPPPPAASVTVMTYNVENMFDVFDDPYTRDETTRVKPRAQIETIAALIARHQPDVIAFQEIENTPVLKAMAQEMLADAGYGDIAVMPTNSERGIHLGVMSRLPVLSMTSHRLIEFDLPGASRTWRFARDLLRVRLDLGAGRVLDLYIVHLKSKYSYEGDEQSRNWRLAEATAIRRIIDANRRSSRSDLALLVGDVNDTPDAPPVAALLAAQPGAPAALVDVHRGLDRAQRITYLRGEHRDTVDYIFASPSLADRLVPGSAMVVSDPAQLGGSDHAPVLATFSLAD